MRSGSRNEAMYGEQTQHAVENFGQGQTPRDFIAALAEVKKAIFTAIQESEHRYTPDVYAAICTAIEEIRCGLHDGAFPLPLAQGGAGTSLHMNFNEVLAELVQSRTNAPFHFLDEGARYQSTNDVIATAVILVACRRLREIESAVIALQEALVAKEQAWRGIVITGRTEWQDALPMSLAQVAGAWAGAVERDRWRLHKIKERLRTVPLGGTAIGTAFFVPPEYLFLAEKHLRAITGLPLSRSQNLPDAIANQDQLAEVASGFSLVAGTIIKLCNDLFFYTSSAVRELVHPRLQWGSTIMPFKTNPVMIEYAKGLAMRANAHCSVVMQYAHEGNLQLNAFLPFMLDGLLHASEDLGAALRALSEKLLPRLEVSVTKIAYNLHSSLALLNALRAVVPYEALKAFYESYCKEGAFSPFASIEDLVRALSKESGIAEEILLSQLHAFVQTEPGATSAPAEKT